MKKIEGLRAILDSDKKLIAVIRKESLKFARNTASTGVLSFRKKWKRSRLILKCW